MLRVPDSLLIHSFTYEEYVGVNRYHEPLYAEPVVFSKVRIDDVYSYDSNSNEKRTDITAVIFYYPGQSEPDGKFVPRSRITINGKETVLVKVITVSSALEDAIFSYELEVA